MEEELDLSDPVNLIDMLIYMRYLELGGSDSSDEETEFGFNILRDNVWSVSDGLGVDSIAFKYHTFDKVLVEKSEKNIRQSVYNKISLDFKEIITLIKNYKTDNKIQPLRDKYDELLEKNFKN